jgi:Ca2+-binding RTX toxin-like protein
VIGVQAAQTGSPPICFGKPATIVGNSGDNDIKGTNGADVIVAGGGENDIKGRDGNDRICGGPDGDDVFGGKGNDKMDSGGQIDFVAGNQGDDLHIAGGGADQIDAVQDSLASDDDVARGKLGRDFIDVMDGEDNDTASGGDGANDECLSDAGDTVVDCEF